MGIIRDIMGPFDPVLGDKKIEEVPCFYCGKSMSYPGIFWVGNSIGNEGSSSLILHPACAVDLFLRLGRDVWEIECKSNTYLNLPLSS